MERALQGLAASPGLAVGRARILATASAVDRTQVPHARRQAEARAAQQALDAAGDEIDAIATKLWSSGQDEEAEIVETGVLIARDPSFRQGVLAAVNERGIPAAAAILDTAQEQAKIVAAIDDARLAERADDIVSVGRRAAGLIGQGAGTDDKREAGGGGEVLVGPDLGPAEVAELDATVTGIALVAGGVSAHAAIVARSLGIPMVVGVGDELLTLAPGDAVVVDGSSGIAFASPGAERVEAASLELSRRADRRARVIASRGLPSVTTDGHYVRVLANVSGAAELEAALEAGAEGVGLLRTELAFLEAPEWPSEAEHRNALAPILRHLDGRTATVRVLDFGGDKTPPFLAGVEERGIELLLQHPGHLAAQLRAIVASAGGSELRVLFPMVASVDQINLARKAVLDAVGAVPGAVRPLIGAMIETSEGVEAVRSIASEADFLSIGTNDLTHSVLDSDRFAPQAARTHDPRVLRAIATVVRAAKEAEVPIEICGEAASDPVAAPLLIGSGVDEVSVGAARVGSVRRWIRSLSFESVSDLEESARHLETATGVEALVADVSERLSLDERADADGEILERPVGVGAAGAEAQRRSARGA
jgi:phosphoenolpyruvate-protein kinase (PTS system EI component)